MKALLLAAALAACDGTTTVTTTTPIVEDPCSSQLYQSPACDTGYTWNPGYYNSYHVWIAPRYVRRPYYAPPVVVHHYTPPVVVHHYTPPVVVRRVSPPPRVYVRPTAPPRRVIINGRRR